MQAHDKEYSKAFPGETEEDLNEGKYHINGKILSEIDQLLLFDLWNQCKANCNPNFLGAKWQTDVAIHIQVIERNENIQEGRERQEKRKQRVKEKRKKEEGWKKFGDAITYKIFL